MISDESFFAFIKRVDAAGIALAAAATAEPAKFGEHFETFKALTESFFKTVRLVGKVPNEVLAKAMADIDAEEAAKTVAH